MQVLTSTHSVDPISEYSSASQPHNTRVLPGRQSGEIWNSNVISKLTVPAGMYIIIVQASVVATRQRNIILSTGGGGGIMHGHGPSHVKHKAIAANYN